MADEKFSSEVHGPEDAVSEGLQQAKATTWFRWEPNVMDTDSAGLVSLWSLVFFEDFHSQTIVIGT